MNYNLLMAALCAWREARGEGQEGIHAVLWVLFNRSKAWGKSLSQVVTQRNQFTSMVVRGDANTVVWPDDNDAVWQQTLQMAQDIQSGKDDHDLTDGALYYENPAVATSAWFQQNIVGSPQWHPQTAVIGHHIFYK